MSKPTVSIITATYNASHILRYAISSVMLSDYSDWELIIVGDCCTDDTEAVVASFAEPRIRFENLPDNSGQQAAPNNHGLTMARGDYVCFLNQDDMYLPCHISSMLEGSLRAPDSILLCRYVDVRPYASESQGAEAAESNLRFHSRGPTSTTTPYQPRQWHIASSWFMPMEIARTAGRWRLEHETFVTPSQDWLFRAWHSGIPVVAVPRLSMIAVCTGGRTQFFHQRRDAVHSYLFERYVSKSDAHAELLAKADAEVVTKRNVARRAVRRLYDASVCELSSRMGIHPNTLEMLLRHGGRGGFIRAWRRGVNLDG